VNDIYVVPQCGQDVEEVPSSESSPVGEELPVTERRETELVYAKERELGSGNCYPVDLMRLRRVPSLKNNNIVVL
jgi:hypothetical protein